MKPHMCRLFLTAEALLYALFLALDFTHVANSIPVKYTSVVFCLLVSLSAARTVDGRLTTLALAFTAGADWFLLVLDHCYVLGVSLFCVVQVLYFLRLVHWRGQVCPPLLVVRLAPLVTFFLIRDTLDALALLYFTNLVCNVLEAVRILPRSNRQRLFVAGLTLFACCDICVGAFHLGLLTDFTRYGMWLFYLPSQVLLTLSAQPKGDYL